MKEGLSWWRRIRTKFQRLYTRKEGFILGTLAVFLGLAILFVRAEIQEPPAPKFKTERPRLPHHPLLHLQDTTPGVFTPN
jgi:hypothetical protein